MPLPITPAPSTPTRMSVALAPDDADEADHLTGVAAEVVHDAEPAVGRLDAALRRRLSGELQPVLEEHPHAARSDGVPERLEPAIRVHREVAVEVEGAVEHLLPALAALGEAEVL